MESEPDYPEELEYLVEWAYTLHGRNGGIGMAGLAPLSFREIEAWARLMDVKDLHPLEVEALIVLDSALITTGTEAETTKDEQVNLKAAKWPTRKTGEA